MVSEEDELKFELNEILKAMYTYIPKDKMDILYKPMFDDVKLLIDTLLTSYKDLEERCHSIWLIGFDYDGYHDSAKDLRKLIDEIVALALGNKKLF